MKSRLAASVRRFACVAFLVCAGNDMPASDSAAPPARAVEFHLKSIAGDDVTLSQFRGKVVLVHFWWTLCSVCQSRFAELKEINRNHPGEVVLLGISVDSPREVTDKVTARLGLTWPQFFLQKNPGFREFAQTNGTPAIPQYWLLDRDGVLRYTNAVVDLAGKLDRLLQEPARPAAPKPSSGISSQ